MPRILLCLALVVTSLAVVAGQQGVFRASRTTIVVPVTVLDQDGFVVKGLRETDFRLFDEGRRQEIVNFASGQAPLTAVVLIDASASMAVGLDLARYAAEQFILRLWPGDRARVGSFSDKLSFNARFTTDRDELLRHIRLGVEIGNPTRLFDAVDQAVSFLASEPGRHVILLLSDGCDTASERLWGEVRDRVRAEDVMLYTVEVPSRMRILPEFRQKRTWTCAEFEGQFMKAPTVGDLLRMNDPRRDQSGGYVLNEFTLDTGGNRIRLLPDDDANTTFTQMMEELHHLYLLGFSPPVLDNEYHRLRVEAADRSLVLRARRGYTAAPAPQR